MSEVSIYTAQNELSELIERALKGEEIVITRRGAPVVRLVPANQHDAATSRQQKRLRAFGAFEGRFEVPDDLNQPLPDDVMAGFEQPMEPSPERPE